MKSRRSPGPGRFRLRWWLLGAAVVVAALAVAGPFVYIHFVEGPAPAKLGLPRTPRTSGAGHPGSRSGAQAGSVTGTWNVGSGSVAGYRVEEVLVGQRATAVGRTTKIWGSLVVSHATVTAGSFTVNMASVKSDQSARNAQFDGRIMDVSRYPTASLTLAAPIDLGTIPADRVVVHQQAVGTLTMHGVSRTVTVPVSAERVDDGLDVLADVHIVFADWKIANPSVGGFVTTANTGTLEVLLHLVRGKGNAPSTGSAGSATGGAASGPITVPRTTVPPLTVPSS